MSSVLTKSDLAPSIQFQGDSANLSTPIAAATTSATISAAAASGTSDATKQVTSAGTASTTTLLFSVTSCHISKVQADAISSAFKSDAARIIKVLNSLKPGTTIQLNVSKNPYTISIPKALMKDCRPLIPLLRSSKETDLFFVIEEQKDTFSLTSYYTHDYSAAKYCYVPNQCFK